MNKEPSGKDRALAVTVMQQLVKKLSRQLSSQQNEIIEEIRPDTEEQTTCTICYTNEIIPAPKPIHDLITWSFKCGHRFCIDCSRELLKLKIERAEVDNLVCFEFKCLEKVTEDEIKELFKGVEPETFQKYKEFVVKKKVEGDPLMRWCTKPGCTGSMRGDDLNAKKVTCPVCKTDVCFQCRDEWHGTDTCEKNMDNKLEGWVQEHGGVSFCPACRTKVEKNEGCNHMTCIYCKYEFCWFCRGWAGPGSDHFNVLNPASCGAG